MDTKLGKEQLVPHALSGAWNALGNLRGAALGAVSTFPAGSIPYLLLRGPGEVTNELLVLLCFGIIGPLSIFVILFLWKLWLAPYQITRGELAKLHAELARMSGELKGQTAGLASTTEKELRGRLEARLDQLERDAMSRLEMQVSAAVTPTQLQLGGVQEDIASLRREVHAFSRIVESMQHRLPPGTE